MSGSVAAVNATAAAPNDPAATMAANSSQNDLMMKLVRVGSSSLVDSAAVEQ